MSLKESARRLYQARAGVSGDAKKRVATQYLQQLPGAIAVSYTHLTLPTIYSV